MHCFVYPSMMRLISVITDAALLNHQELPELSNWEEMLGLCGSFTLVMIHLGSKCMCCVIACIIVRTTDSRYPDGMVHCLLCGMFLFSQGPCSCPGDESTVYSVSVFASCVGEVHQVMYLQSIQDYMIIESTC